MLFRSDEILEIIKNNTQFDFDSYYSKKEENFDFDCFEYFLKRNNLGTDLEKKDVLKSMRLVNFEGDFNNASILLFGKNVQQVFPSAYLECVLFKGDDNSEVIDRKRVNGNLFEQLKEGMIFLKKHLKVRYEFPDELRREIYDVPLRALEEALVNALIHRDYSFRGANISLFIYPDRVEVLSPGGFVPGFNRSDFGKVSIRRNELIADIFSKTEYVEKIGSGIRRMKSLCLEQGNPEPVFDVNSFFIIKFSFSKKVTEKVTDRVTEKVTDRVTENQEKILESIFKDKLITVKELSKIVGISERKIKENIKKLKQKGLLKRIGPAKGGYWEVIENGK